MAGISLTVVVDIPTPCGSIGVKIPLGLAIPIPALPFPPFPFPPKFRIPFPDCSLLKRIGGVPEPAEDSVP